MVRASERSIPRLASHARTGGKLKGRAPVLLATSRKDRGTPMVKWGTTPLHHDELGTPGKHPVHRLTVAPPHKLFAIDTGACNEQRHLKLRRACTTGNARSTLSLLCAFSSFCLSAAGSSCSWPLPDGSCTGRNIPLNLGFNPSWRCTMRRSVLQREASVRILQPHLP
jgi:hypothetical protein